ncbi:hypothetical protein [Tessaracoccus sp.]
MTNLALIQPLTAGQRRRHAEKLNRYMPRDAAHTAVNLIAAPNPTPAPAPARDPFQSYVFEQHESGLNSLARQRVLLPFIDPNHLQYGRLIAEVRLPRPTLTDDGILTVTWTSRIAQNAAIRKSVGEYLKTHEIIPQITELVGFNGLDSWHSPLVLVPVRHQYTDGSPTQLRWMTVDGTARIVAFRKAVTKLFPWLKDGPDHPYQHVYGNWIPDGMGMATWRSFLAAVRTQATEDALRAALPSSEDPPDIESLKHPEWFARDGRFTQDWGTLILPGPDGADPTMDLEGWLMLSHRSHRDND